MKKKLFLILVIGAALIFAGCGGEKQETLNVFNWGEYIDEDLISKFEEETGIKVNYETFSTNEDMYVKVKSGGSSYDVLIPSDYMIEKMAKEDLLQELDYSKIPNITNISPMFQDLIFDPDNKYSVPYFWGTVGILYNTEQVDDVVDSWDILWNEKYANKILMMDSQRDSLAVALKKLGYSMNTRNETELEEAKQELIEQKPLVLAYIVDEIRDKMLSGEGAVAVAWSGDAMDVILSGETFEYIVPKEGSNFWIDAMVVPANAKNPDAAHKFINFMTDPENAAANSEYIGYSTPNEAALELLPEEMINSDVAYPSQEVIDNCEIFRDPGDFISVYNRIWTEVTIY
ncbi:MAG: ABC transporter substrate-binding protein [Clostridia bacterium]|nr:ABC transporter substrate-binding protein [Clostridia bacterium]